MSIAKKLREQAHQTWLDQHRSVLEERAIQGHYSWSQHFCSQDPRHLAKYLEEKGGFTVVISSLKPCKNSLDTCWHMTIDWSNPKSLTE